MGFMMKRRFLTLIVALAATILIPLSACAAFSNETLRYVISYKWGMVHKDTGEATLSLRNSGGKYNITLTAKTKPWADKIFMVRDTLRSTVTASGLKPVSYSKITHEGGKYARDDIKFSVSGSTVKATSTRVKEKKGKRTTSSATMSATSPAYDMLSVFYYLRILDFPKMQKGHSYKASIFSGKQVETLNIKLIGVEKIKLRDKRTLEAYHIRFNFTSEGKKKSSADMDTWISTDSRHIPLLLEGSLPVGKVKCYYVGG